MDISLPLGSITLPTALVVASTLAFLALERVFPGRDLPYSKGCYTRVIFANLTQLLITLAIAILWIEIMGVLSLLKLSYSRMPILEAFVSWFCVTFLFL